MTTVTIDSRELGRKVSIMLDDKEPIDAWFSNGGFMLEREWLRLVSNNFDMQRAQEEVEKYYG